MASLESSTTFKQWEDDTLRFRLRHGIPAGYFPWSSSGRPALEFLTSRTKAMVEAQWALVPQPRTGRGMFQDLSQGILRSKPGQLSTMLRHSSMFDYDAGDLVTAPKLLALLGYPVELPFAYFSDAFLTKLAGDCMALPCIGVITTSYYLNPMGPWWNGELASTSGSQQAAE